MGFGVVRACRSPTLKATAARSQRWTHRSSVVVLVGQLPCRLVRPCDNPGRLCLGILDRVTPAQLRHTAFLHRLIFTRDFATSFF
jgi:hypothetical protein